MQYQAGYFLNSIFDLFLNHAVKDKVEKIVYQLCHFELDTTAGLKHTLVDHQSELNVVNNLLQRGFPTLPSTFIADLFATTFGRTKRETDIMNTISHPFIDDLLSEELYKAIHIIDPRIKLSSQKEMQEDLAKAKGIEGKRFDFKYSFFPEYLGHYFIQLMDENRTFESIVQSVNPSEKQTILSNFEKIAGRKQDFVLEMPYPHQNVKGIAIELDDKPVETSYEFEIDNLKQGLCKQIGWAKPLDIETFRLDELNKQLRPLIDFTYNDYFDTIARNFRSPLYKSTDGLIALQYALSPIAIARIEKTILEFLFSGILSLNDPIWKIGVIERDVPCGHLALHDLKLHFENMFALQGKSFKFPEIKLSIYNTEEFKTAGLNAIYHGEIRPIEKFDEQIDFDLLIDISILQRHGLSDKEYRTKAKQVAIIRSARHISAKYCFHTDKRINYPDFLSPDLDEKQQDKAKNALKYFMKNIFRKDGFMPGQMELINKCLQQKNTLGNMPPSSGKTISAWLSMILQPGISLFICPTEYLMAYHQNELKKLRINQIAAFGELTYTASQEENLLRQVETPSFHLIFTTVEYFRYSNFRNAIAGLSFNKLFSNYLVIDEAHCLSPWGHQFNPQLLKIQQFKEEIFKNPVRQPISTIALTGTANYNCTWEICRELQIRDENIIKTTHKESDINFKVIDTTSKQTKLEPDLHQIEKTIRQRKYLHFATAIKDINPDGQKGVPVLVFDNLHEGLQSKPGQENLIEKLNNTINSSKTGIFSGTRQIGPFKPNRYLGLHSIAQAEKFNKNEYSTLFSSPEYGTGSGKENIRHIIYLQLPHSIEDFIQQTYRAGIDGNKSSCTILYDKQEFIVPPQSHVGQYLNEGKTNFDTYQAYEHALTAFQGKIKETAILEQLWSGFAADTCNPIEIIADQIWDRYQFEVDMQFQPAKEPKRLYVYTSGKMLGYIDLVDLTCHTEESRFDKTKSTDILEFAAWHIKCRDVGNENLLEILTKPNNDGSLDTIFEVFQNISHESFVEMPIPFSNNGIQLIFEKLKQLYPEKITKHQVKNLYRTSLSEFDFIENLQAIVPINQNKELIEELTRYYRNTWLKNECELALYRLAYMGIVEDYEVDAINQVFITRIRKKTFETCLNNYSQIIDTQLMAEYASVEKNTIKKLDDNDFFGLLMHQVDAFYSYVLPYRFHSIETFHYFLSQIPDNKSNNNETNQSIKDLMDRFFYAKYANSKLSLVAGIKSMMDSHAEFSTLKGYMLNVGPLKENWLHLQKSSEFIIRQTPDAFTPYLLLSYSDIIGGLNDMASLDKAFDQIARGFIKMRRQKTYNRESYQSEIQLFLDILFKNRPDLKRNFEEILWLRMHYIWLKDFNTKIH
jgi:hypothetical protein